MAFTHGKDAYFACGDQADKTTADDISAYVKSVSFPRPVDTAETSAFGSEAKSHIVGLIDGTISIEGLWDATIDARLANILQLQDVAFVYGPAGSTGGNVKYSGNAILSSYEVSADIGDVVTFSAEFQVTGAVTRGTF